MTQHSLPDHPALNVLWCPDCDELTPSQLSLQAFLLTLRPKLPPVQQTSSNEVADSIADAELLDFDERPSSYWTLRQFSYALLPKESTKGSIASATSLTKPKGRRSTQQTFVVESQPSLGAGASSSTEDSTGILSNCADSPLVAPGSPPLTRNLTSSAANESSIPPSNPHSESALPSHLPSPDAAIHTLNGDSTETTMNVAPRKTSRPPPPARPAPIPPSLSSDDSSTRVSVVGTDKPAPNGHSAPPRPAQANSRDVSPSLAHQACKALPPPPNRVAPTIPIQLLRTGATSPPSVPSPSEIGNSDKVSSLSPSDMPSSPPVISLTSSVDLDSSDAADSQSSTQPLPEGFDDWSLLSPSPQPTLHDVSQAQPTSTTSPRDKLVNSTSGQASSQDSVAQQEEGGPRPRSNTAPSSEKVQRSTSRPLPPAPVPQNSTQPPRNVAESPPPWHPNNGQDRPRASPSNFTRAHRASSTPTGGLKASMPPPTSPPPPTPTSNDKASLQAPLTSPRRLLAQQQREEQERQAAKGPPASWSARSSLPPAEFTSTDGTSGSPVFQRPQPPRASMPPPRMSPLSRSDNSISQDESRARDASRIVIERLKLEALLSNPPAPGPIPSIAAPKATRATSIVLPSPATSASSIKTTASITSASTSSGSNTALDHNGMPGMAILAQVTLQPRADSEKLVAGRRSGATGARASLRASSGSVSAMPTPQAPERSPTVSPGPNLRSSLADELSGWEMVSPGSSTPASPITSPALSPRATSPEPVPKMAHRNSILDQRASDHFQRVDELKFKILGDVSLGLGVSTMGGLGKRLTSSDNQPISLTPPASSPAPTQPTSATSGSASDSVAPESPFAVRNIRAFEILSTEATYLMGLEHVLRNVLGPLQHNAGMESATMADLYATGNHLTPAQAPSIRKEEIKMIFNNLESLYVTNVNFFTKLLSVFQDWNEETSTLGQVFIDFAQYLRVAYSVYLSDLGTALGFVNIMTKKSPKFGQFMTFFSDLKESEKRPLADFLSTPMQRITRYEILLDALKKVTPSTHPDAPILEKAMTVVKQTLRQVNASPAEVEKRSEMIELQARFAESIIEPARLLIKEDELNTRYITESAVRRTVFLFTDALITAVPSYSGYLYIHQLWPLHEVVAMDRNDDDSDPHSFWILTPLRTHVFSCGAAEQKAKWMSAINQGISKIVTSSPEMDKNRNRYTIHLLTKNIPLLVPIEAERNPQHEAWAEIHAIESQSKGFMSTFWSWFYQPVTN